MRVKLSEEEKKARQKAYAAKYRADHLTEIAADAKRRYEKNRTQRIAASKKRYVEKRAEIAAYHKQHHLEHREETSNYKRELKFGISPIDFNRMCDEHGWVCAICGGMDIDRTPSKHPGRAKTLHIDHDHRHKGSGVKVRGLLCIKCNMGLGYFRDSLGLLRNAQQYLLDRG